MAELRVTLPARQTDIAPGVKMSFEWYVALQNLFERVGGPAFDKVEQTKVSAEAAQAAADGAQSAADAAQNGVDLIDVDLRDAVALNEFLR